MRRFAGASEIGVWAPDRFQAPSRQQNSAHFGPKIGPKIDPAAFQNRFGKRLRNKLAFETDLGPIVDRSWLDLGWPLDPKILQNYVRGVRNQTLRIYTFDVDPMSFRTDSRHPKMAPKLSQNGPKALRRRSVDGRRIHFCVSKSPTLVLSLVIPVWNRFLIGLGAILTQF